jgi:3-oxoadipate enol-lactonase
LARSAPEFGRYFHAVAWDARGYGDSDDYDGDLDFGDFATDLARLLDHFNVSRAHLVGLSMGGVIGLDFVSRCQACSLLVAVSVKRR